MEEVKWINIAKTVAIAGVLIQHVNGWLYSDEKIFQSVTYAVAVFIMIGGYLTARSYEQRGIVCIRKKLRRLLVPCIVSTVIYVFYTEKNRFGKCFLSYHTFQCK